MTTNDIDDVIMIDTMSRPLPFTESGLHQDLTSNSLSHYYILTHTQKTIGYVGYWLMANECHITTIVVTPAEQSNGYGELLLLTALIQAYEQNAQVATLEVRETNHVAQQLYLKTGFAIVGERKRFYKDTRENAMIMTLSPFTRPPLTVQWNVHMTRLVAKQKR